MTNNAYRDDLEAALARASDLEREVAELQRRNAELEMGDRQTIEARENAHRLAAALERERDELRHDHNRQVDDAGWRRAAREAANARAAKVATNAPAGRSDEFKLWTNGIAGLVVGSLAGLVAITANNGWVGAASIAMLTVAVVFVVDANSLALKRRQKSG
jgi:hypothetical protein